MLGCWRRSASGSPVVEIAAKIRNVDRMTIGMEMRKRRSA
jgi:hypothetical protein